MRARARTRALRPDGRVHRPRRARRRRPQRAYAAGYRRMDAYSPFPVEGLAEAIGFTHEPAAAGVLLGGLLGRRRRLLHAVVLAGDRLPAQRRRPAAQQLAGVHPDHVRADDPVRGVRGGLRDARPERPARSRTTRCSTCPSFAHGVAEPLLPLHRGRRPEVRPRRRPASSSKAWARGRSSRSRS